MKIISTFFFLTLCCGLCPTIVCGQHTIKGIIKDTKAQSIVGATVIIRSLNDTHYYKGSITDEAGQFIIDKIESGKYNIDVSFIGYVSHHRELLLHKSIDVGEIILDEQTTQLDEVVVTASMIKNFADKKEYKLTNKEKEQSSSVLSALEYLPKIQVIDHSVNTNDGKEVKILINGIPSTPADLSVISAESIFKIDYYSYPPIQYSNMGLGAVINVVTKDRQSGGSIGINTLNAFTTGFGNNVFNFKHNWKNSQVGITYNIDYRNYDKRVLNEFMNYDVGGRVFQKQKKGKNSPYAYEQQLAEISFNNSISDNYLFSAKISFNSFNRRRSSAQDLISNIDSVLFKKSAYSSDKDKYLNPVMDLYFSKTFNLKHEFTFNMVGTYYKSDYQYNYLEFNDEVTDFETNMNVDIDKYSVISEAMYNYSMQKAQLQIGAKYIYNNSKQTSLSSNNRIQTNEIYSYLGIIGTLGQRFTYNLGASVNGNIFTTLDNNKYEFFYFRPQVRFGYLIDESSDLTFNYKVNTESPTISSLTYNPYYKDSNLLFVGNPNLKPCNSNEISLSYTKETRKFIVNTEIGYKHTKGVIVPIFQSNDTNIIETFGNLDYAQDLSVSTFLKWSPLSSNMFTIRLYSKVFHQINVFENTKWSHTGYLLAPSVNFVYKNWGALLLYQTDSKLLVGQTVKTRPSMAYLEISNSSIKNLTLTGGIRYPFYKSWKQTIFTSGTPLLCRTESESIVDNANMVYVKLIYNLSFGKSKSNVKLKIINKDKDSGILNRN